MLLCIFLLYWSVVTFVKGSKYKSCCDYAEANESDYDRDHEYLLNCINDSISLQTRRASSKKSFLLMTYATDDIHDYASYSLAVNSLYAENKGYSFKFLSPQQGSQYYANDERWNKVRILMESIDSKTGWGIDFDYVCFLDADLIVLDMDLDLEELVTRHSWADMLISQDSEPINGVINSGMKIFQSTNNCASNFIVQALLLLKILNGHMSSFSNGGVRLTFGRWV
jgi:galactosyl transferase GMA12/MNN10 family